MSVKELATVWCVKACGKFSSLSTRHQIEPVSIAKGLVGDLLVGDMRGFHKGQQVLSGSRLMFTVNFLVHPEMDGLRLELPRTCIRSRDVESLPDEKKSVADFLTTI